MSQTSLTRPGNGRTLKPSLAFRAIRRVHRRIGWWIQQREREWSDRELFGRANLPWDEAGYDELREVTTFLKYRQQIHDGFPGPSESRALYERQVETLSRFLREHPEIRTVLNFGICYGHVDSIIAERFPELLVCGIDRSPFTKAMNEAVFNKPNLAFLAGNIFDALASGEYKEALLLHSRTCALLTRPTVEALYQAAREAGIAAIVTYEQYGVSRETGSSYVFDLTPKPSVVYRDRMFLHNYPALLMAAGFPKIEWDSFKTDHPHPDFRVLEVIATG